MKNLFLILSIHFIHLLPSFVYVASVKKNQLSFFVDHHSIFKMSFFIKRYSNSQVHYLSDICAVDFPKRVFRFEIIYNFLSLTFNSRVRLKTLIHELISLNSITLLFLSASWLERELWDLFGIYFFDHLRLRRILTDYGFFGYPLRKEFPTGGFLEVRYDEMSQKILYEAVQFNSFSRFLYAKL